MSGSKLQRRSRHLSLAWAGPFPRQSVAQQCRLFPGGHRVVVDNGCRHTGYAGRGLLPACSGSHTKERCTYRESCKSGKSNTELFCLLGMMPEFWLTAVSLSAENMCPLWCKKANWLLLRSCLALL